MEGAFWALVALALTFLFVNGLNDSGSLVGTLISSGALSARQAFALAAVAELIGALVGGTAVAATIGTGVVTPGAISIRLLLAAVLGALLWGITAGRLGLPTSATHALVGGMVGAGFVAAGPGAIVEAGVARIAFALAVGPFVALVCGWLLMRLVLTIARGFSPRINQPLKHLQIYSALAIALSHGANDSQKGMGVITLGLLALGAIPAFAVPGWVQVVSAVAIAGGVAVGGGRILRTLGARIYRIRPIHGFTAQTCSALIVLLATALGGPMSTTQVATSAIFGVGAAERPSRVRWELGRQILLVWLVTVPLAALLAVLVFAALGWLPR